MISYKTWQLLEQSLSPFRDKIARTWIEQKTNELVSYECKHCLGTHKDAQVVPAHDHDKPYTHYIICPVTDKITKVKDINNLIGE